MLYASIDIGSNAARLLFANVYETEKGPIAEKATLVRIPLRLGLDVFNYNRILEERQQMLMNTLKAYKLLIDVYKPIEFKACATSAMRDAENGKELAEIIQKEIGIDIEIIDGIKESQIISENVSYDFEMKYKYSLNVDLGGGSTEFSLRKGKDFIDSRSFDIGTIRHMFGQVQDSEWLRMKEWLTGLKDEYGWVNCIGSGGNVNKLVKIYGVYLDNYITEKQMNHAYDELQNTTMEDRIHKLGMRPDRADVILPATDILIKVFKWGGINKMYAPKIGLADGIVLSMFKKNKKL